MLVKKSLLDRLAADLSIPGKFQLHWAKLTIVDGVLVARDNHIRDIYADSDIEAELAIEVNALAMLGFPFDLDDPISIATLFAAKTYAAAAWTPAVIAAWSVIKAEREETLRKESEKLRIASEKAEAAQLARFLAAVRLDRDLSAEGITDDSTDRA